MERTKLDLRLLLPSLAVTFVLCLFAQPSSCQSADDATRNSSSPAPAHSQPMPAANGGANNAGVHNSVADVAISFQGRIVKSGNKCVLAATDETTYQLDDQRKAHNFLNQNVKVTGVLDATTGTIRVNAIDPV